MDCDYFKVTLFTQYIAVILYLWLMVKNRKINKRVGNEITKHLFGSSLMVMHGAWAGAKSSVYLTNTLDFPTDDPPNITAPRR